MNTINAVNTLVNVPAHLAHAVPGGRIVTTPGLAAVWGSSEHDHRAKLAKNDPDALLANRFRQKPYGRPFADLKAMLKADKK